MDPIQKWQWGLPLTDYEKQTVRNFGYNPDVPYAQNQGSQLQPTTGTQDMQGSSNIGDTTTPIALASQPASVVTPPAPGVPPPAATPAGENGTGLPDGYPKAFEGKLYNSPEELASAVHASAQLKVDENNKKIDRLYKSGLITYQEYLQQARDNVESVKKTYTQNLANIQGYYNKISPDAVQSNQNVTQNTATTDYNKTQANTGDLFNGAAAGDIAKMDLSPYANDITTTGKLARGIQGVNQAQTDSQKNNTDYMNSVNNDNFAMLHPSPTTANTGLTDFLQNLAVQVYGGSTAGSGITGQTTSQAVDAYGNPIKKTDEFGNPIK